MAGQNKGKARAITPDPASDKNTTLSLDKYPRAATLSPDKPRQLRKVHTRRRTAAAGPQATVATAQSSLPEGPQLRLPAAHDGDEEIRDEIICAASPWETQSDYGGSDYGSGADVDVEAEPDANEPDADVEAEPDASPAEPIDVEMLDCGDEPVLPKALPKRRGPIRQQLKALVAFGLRHWPGRPFQQFLPGDWLAGGLLHELLDMELSEWEAESHTAARYAVGMPPARLAKSTIYDGAVMPFHVNDSNQLRETRKNHWVIAIISRTDKTFIAYGMGNAMFKRRKADYEKELGPLAGSQRQLGEYYPDGCCAFRCCQALRLAIRYPERYGPCLAPATKKDEPSSTPASPEDGPPDVQLPAIRDGPGASTQDQPPSDDQPPTTIRSFYFLAEGGFAIAGSPPRSLTKKDEPSSQPKAAKATAAKSAKSAKAGSSVEIPTRSGKSYSRKLSAPDKRKPAPEPPTKYGISIEVRTQYGPFPDVRMPDDDEPGIELSQDKAPPEQSGNQPAIEDITRDGPAIRLLYLRRLLKSLMIQGPA